MKKAIIFSLMLLTLTIAGCNPYKASMKSLVDYYIPHTQASMNVCNEALTNPTSENKTKALKSVNDVQINMQLLNNEFKAALGEK